MFNLRVKVVYGERILSGILVYPITKRGLHTVKLDDGELFKTQHHWPGWWPDRAILDYLRCTSKEQKRILTHHVFNLWKCGRLDHYKVIIQNDTVYGPSLLSYMIKDIT